jgi:hypothetical protein
MSDYITGAELKAFTNIDSLAAAVAATLEANLILRTKKIIDKWCFTQFDDADTTTDAYAEIQLAQKLLSERLYLRDNQDVKAARIIIGKGGSEKKGADWSYSLGDIEELMTDEIKNLLEEHRDWTKDASYKDKPKTGRILLKGDVFYESEINSQL